MAEFVRIDRVVQGEPCGYDVVIDRISQDVPFYRAWLKNAALTGTAVVNNPFWWSADEKFFNNALATKIGVAVPQDGPLALEPNAHGHGRKFIPQPGLPTDWEGIFEYVGWPAFFKPFAGGGWKNVYRLHNPDEFFRAYNETGQLVMMLQEEVKFDMYFRCYWIDQRHVKVMPTSRAILIICAMTPTGTRRKDPRNGRVGCAAIEPISGLRLEHGRIRDPRWRAAGDRFLQSGAGRGSAPVSDRKTSSGWSKRSRHGDSQSQGTCVRTR